MIEIYAVSYSGRPQPPELAGCFGPEGGTLGRGTDNRLSLPDPARHVSRVQAAIRFDGTSYLIRNLSEANPLFLNDEEIGYGREHVLLPGDSLRVGLYQLGIRESGAIAPGGQPAAAVAPRRPAAPASGPLDPLVGLGQDAPGLNPFADLLGTASPLAAPGVATAARPVPAVSSSSPFADLLGNAAPAPAVAGAPRSALSVASSNPFSDLLGPGAPEGGTGLRPTGAVAGSAAAGATPIIPDDFDVFALPSKAPRNTDDPLRDLAGASIELKSVDANAQRSDLLEFKLERKAAPDDLLQGGTPSLVDPFQAVDPLELFGGADDALLRIGGDPLGGSAPMPDSLPELGANFRPPRSMPDSSAPATAATAAAASPVAVFPAPGRGRVDDDPLAAIVAAAPSVAVASPAAVPAAATANQASAGAAPAAGPAAAVSTPPVAQPWERPPAPQPDASAANADALLAAFVKGTGMAGLHFPNGLTPEVMEGLGAFVAGATAGTMSLIAARRRAGRFFNAEQTVVPRAASNPLKFMPTPEAAIMQMFGPRMPGFLPMADAMRAAFDEMLAHELGVLAGTRAAVAEALHFLDPEELQRAVVKGAVVDRLLPNAREARLWAIYEERYREVRAGFDDGFQARFGDAFRAAYAACAAQSERGSPAG